MSPTVTRMLRNHPWDDGWWIFRKDGTISYPRIFRGVKPNPRYGFCSGRWDMDTDATMERLLAEEKKKL